MTLSRRGFLSGLGSMLAAPAIVHAGNLMPVRVIEPEWDVFDAIVPIQPFGQHYVAIVHPSMYRDFMREFGEDAVGIDDRLMPNEVLRIFECERDIFERATGIETAC